MTNSYVNTKALNPSSQPLSKSGSVFKSICSLCNGGCGLKVIVENEKIKAVWGDSDNPYNQGKICSKPMSVAQTLYSPKRVVSPLKRIGNEFFPMGWDEALDLIANKYNAYIDEYGNDSIIGITSKVGGSFSKLGLNIFSQLTGLVTYGTGPICFDSEEKVRREMFGNGSSTSPLSDIIKSKLIIILGNNCAQTKPGQFWWIQKARELGTKVVVIDTRLTETAEQADVFIKIRPGTDGALGLALLNFIISNNLYDFEFVKSHTNGFETLKEAILPYTPEYASSITGIPLQEIIDLANDLVQKKPGMLWEGRGVACVSNATTTIMAFEAIMAILGNIGKPGSGIISHINNHGSPKNIVNAEDIVKPTKRRSVETLYSEMENKNIKMIIIAGNPCVTWPDSERFSNGLKNIEFVVSHTLFLDDTSLLADIILPATHWFEESGVQPSVHRVLQWRDQVVKPYGESKSGGELYYLLASRMGLKMEYFPHTPEEAWELERQHNPDIAGVTLSKLKNVPGGVHFPATSEDHESERMYEDGKFLTPSGKIELTSSYKDQYVYIDPWKANETQGVESSDFPYVFSTVKVASHYHTECQNSEWTFSLEKPYVEVHPFTAKELGVCDGDNLRLTTISGSIVLPVKTTWRVQPGCFYTQPYFSENSFYKLKAANTLFPAIIDPWGGGFINKNILCSAKVEGETT